GALGHDEQYRLVYHGEVDVYENLHAGPRAFLVGAARAASGPAEAAATLADAGFDPARMAVVEGTLPPDFPSEPVATGTRDVARILEHRAQRVEVAVHA